MIRKQPASSSYLLGVRGFLSHYGVDHSEARRYSVKDYGEGVIGIDLNDSYQAVGRK